MSLAEKYLPRYTIEDYRRWEGDWELIEGMAYALAPSPYGEHQKILMEIGRQISNQLRHCSHKCFVYPELDWIIDEDTVVRPDLMVVCKEVQTHLKEPPLVVVEIVSKSTAQKDQFLKYSLYEKEKVKFYVLVYPEIQKLRVFKLRDNAFEKVFDSHTGRFQFELEKGCKFTIDVDEVFK